jgi:Zinc-binding dehydrogenase
VRPQASCGAGIAAVRSAVPRGPGQVLGAPRCGTTAARSPSTSRCASARWRASRRGSRSSSCRRALTPSGTYVLIGHDGFGASAGPWFGSIGRFLGLLARSPFVSRRISPRNTTRTEDPLGVLAALAEAGELTPAVDRTFPLSEVPAAIAYLVAGRARGKVVITI